MKGAFTLIELLIVVSLIAVLSVSIISVINPIEQTKKASDAAIKVLLSDIFKAHLRYSSDASKDYFSEPVVAISLSSSESLPFIDTLISAKELKQSILADVNLKRIFLSAKSINDITLCFLPESKSSQRSSENNFDIQGQLKPTCLDNSCYYCLANIAPLALVTPIPTQNPDPCASFDPEYPNYPHTTNNSAKWAAYGCTNYSTTDMGCGVDNYCPSTQRHIKKGYYSVPFSDLCTLKWTKTTEDYCVPEPYANCVAHPNPSSDLDFNHGCTNPMRPMSWK